MNRKPFLLALFAAVLAPLWAAPLLAHHSQAAEFDTGRTLTLKGVITKVDWINPHVFIYMDVKDASGKTAQYSLQSFPTRFFHNSGLTKESLLGYGTQEVTVILNPAKDGTNYGWIRRITFPDGKIFAVGPEAIGDQK